MECEFCKNTFKTKNSLYNHQNRAKYCIKLQNREEAIKTYTCAWCDKSFIREDCFKTHKNKCTYISEDVSKLHEKIDNQYEEAARQREEAARQREEAARLQEENISQREEIASLKVFKKLYDKKDDITKTANTRNTIVFPGSLDLSQEHIKHIVDEKLTIDHIHNGQEGLAKFFVEHLLTKEGKPLYIRSDTFRNNYNYKGMNGEIVRDHNARNLTKAIYKPVRIKVKNVAATEINGIDIDAMMSVYGSIINLDKDNTAFCKTLNKLLQILSLSLSLSIWCDIQKTLNFKNDE